MNKRVHTRGQFETFCSQLKRTNVTLDFFVDFKKVSYNVEEVLISLHTLNYLLGQSDLRSAVNTLWQKDKTVFGVLDILIATRRSNNKMFYDPTDGQYQCVDSLFESPEGVLTFLEGTGLAELFRSKKIQNLVDYVFGIEVGLDSNARKNRSGRLMEAVVAKMFSNAGVVFERQVSSKNYPKVSAVLGTDQKVFDFVITHHHTTYLIETNFYSGGGSKLNEVARSYTELAPKINALRGYEFVWITDGIGWFSAKNKLEEAFYLIPKIYNLTTLPQFIALLRR